MKEELPPCAMIFMTQDAESLVYQVLENFALHVQNELTHLSPVIFPSLCIITQKIFYRGIGITRSLQALQLLPH